MERTRRKADKRYRLLDDIRGLNLISMILYHLCWDLVVLYGMDWGWYRSAGAHVWQQSICWIFIFLSGFCWSLGRRRARRGLIVLGASALVSIVTCLFVPEGAILFGVLTLLGSCMLILIPAERALKKIPPAAGLGISAACFFLLRNVNERCLGFEGLVFCRLPGTWYRNLVTAYLGFPPKSFYSADYFSLLPWFFLFLAGYFCFRIWEGRKCRRVLAAGSRMDLLSLLGRRSLLVYLLHQPLIYLVLSLIFQNT